MFIHFKFYDVLFNGLAVLIVATGMIVGPILENSIFGGLFGSHRHSRQGSNDFKNFNFKVEMSRFACTTYAKTLIELRTCVRGVPLDGLEG